jgi:hypothetical protein
VAKEVESLLAVIFAARRKTGKVDLEALEMATRAALHRAGAAVLEELLAAEASVPGKFPALAGSRPTITRGARSSW